MRTGNLVECINDIFLPKQIEMIPHRPQKKSIYEVRKALHTRMGKAYLLVEIENPVIDDPVSGMKFEPSFNVKRFVIVDDESGNQLKEKISELLEEEIY
jgi:hypothetical protein